MKNLFLKAIPILVFAFGFMLYAWFIEWRIADSCDRRLSFYVKGKGIYICKKWEDQREK